MPEFITLEFMQRALLAGAATALPLALLGIFVNAKGMAFFGDGVAHASLAGIAIGLLVGINPLWGAMLVAVIFAIGMALFDKYTKLRSDTILGFMFTVGMAIGVILLTFSKGYQPDLMSYLFGNILTISYADLWLIIPFSVITTILLLLLYRSILLLVINREMAWLSGIPVLAAELLLYVFLAITVVIGVKLLGIVLISALLIVPVAAGRQLATSLKSMLVQSVIYAELIVLGGLVVSYYLDLPSGAVIVLVGAVLFGVLFGTAKLKQVFVK